jgi:hypothetical protein
MKTKLLRLAEIGTPIQLAWEVVIQKVLIQPWTVTTQIILNQKWVKGNLFLLIQKLTETSQIELVCNTTQDLEPMPTKQALSNTNSFRRIKLTKEEL